MSLPELTPDTIRRAALVIVARNPQGIRQSQLFNYVEYNLSKVYSFSEHAVKNALWNLEDLYPDYINKERLSPKVATLYPKEELIRDVDKFNENPIPNYEEKESAVKRARLMKHLEHILSLVEDSDFQESMSLSNDEIANYYSLPEVHAILYLQTAIKQIRISRDAIYQHSLIRERKGEYTV